jgi:adenylate cyclase class IV
MAGGDWRASVNEFRSPRTVAARRGPGIEGGVLSGWATVGSGHPQQRRAERRSSPDDPRPCTNVETKARCEDLEALAERARAAGGRYEGRLDQVDTYFAVEDGRLKLREQARHAPDGGVETTAELIGYRRPDQRAARISEYTRVPVADGGVTRAELGARHGVRGTVVKRRQLWLLDATRIHLDDVDGLGSFVELETVFEGETEPAARVEHERVLGLLGIRPESAIPDSYVDLA